MAAHLCEADMAVIARQKGEAYHLTTAYGYPSGAEEHLKTVPHMGRGSIVGRTVLEGKTVHVADVLADPEFTNTEIQQRYGLRTVLGVPLLREGKPIGVISLARNKVRPFTEKQIELVRTFADQAVIAIENARLLSELRQRTDDLSESLEQQTATSEVLRAISSSSGKLEPVFQTMLENATTICEAAFGSMLLVEGEVFRRVALHNAPPMFVEFHKKSPVIPLGQVHDLNLLLETRRPVHIADAAGTADSPIVKYGGARTLVIVPMLKEGEIVGAIGIYRQEVRPFTDKQIELVTNFAAQAVIAIENARLLNELRESLQQQTATSEVLSVISSSPGELEPVFQAMLETAARVCQAKFGNVWLLEDGTMRPVASLGVPEPLVEFHQRGPHRPHKDAPIMRVARTKQPAHVVDFATERAYIERNPLAVATVELGGVRTLLAVPMLKQSELIGVFAIYRQEVRAFAGKQIELVTNFASQAVIAIENARLLTELRQRTAN